jgi:hypothetical protein
MLVSITGDLYPPQPAIRVFRVLSRLSCYPFAPFVLPFRAFRVTLSRLSCYPFMFIRAIRVTFYVYI